MQTFLETQKRKDNIHAERLARCDLYTHCGGVKGEMLGVCVMEDTYEIGNVRGCSHTYS